MNQLFILKQVLFYKKTLIYLNQFIEPIINMTKYVINTSYYPLITESTVSPTMNQMSKLRMLTKLRMLRRNRRLDSSRLEERGALCSLPW